MKIRIKGSSVRIRLSRTEVGKLVHDGYLEESTPFGAATFKYALQKQEAGNALTASFDRNCITMMVPESLVKNWDTNSLITIENSMPVDEYTTLHLLLEKDFQCLDAVTEDQSDNYLNPNKTC